MSQHEQDVSAWLVIFPSVDKDFGAEQAQVCVLHLGGWGLWFGLSAIRDWQCHGCYSRLKSMALLP